MKSIVSGLARSGEVERDTALISREVEIAGDKLCALINPDCFREILPAPSRPSLKSMTYRRGLLKKCRGPLDFFEGRAAFSIFLKAAVLTH